MGPVTTAVNGIMQTVCLSPVNEAMGRSIYLIAIYKLRFAEHLYLHHLQSTCIINPTPNFFSLSGIFHSYKTHSNRCHCKTLYPVQHHLYLHHPQ